MAAIWGAADSTRIDRGALRHSPVAARSSRATTGAVRCLDAQMLLRTVRNYFVKAVRISRRVGHELVGAAADVSALFW